MSVSINHIAAGGRSISLAITQICKSTKACIENSPVPRQDYCFDHRFFASNAELVARPREQLIAAIKDSRIVRISDKTAPSHPAPQPDKLSGPPHHKAAIYRITKSAALRLKAQCNPLSGLEYVSTYDAIAALLWRGFMRARSQINPSFRKEES